MHWTQHKKIICSTYRENKMMSKSNVQQESESSQFFAESIARLTSQPVDWQSNFKLRHDLVRQSKKSRAACLVRQSKNRESAAYFSSHAIKNRERVADHPSPAVKEKRTRAPQKARQPANPVATNLLKRKPSQTIKSDNLDSIKSDKRQPPTQPSSHPA